MSKKVAEIPSGKISLDELTSALTPMSKAVENRVNALMNLHDKFLDSYKKYQAETRALEEKYFKEHYAAIFDKRNEIISGKYEPTAEEATYARDEDEEEEKEDKKDQKAGDEKGIPDFWSTCLQNNSVTSGAIFEEDEEALSFLTDIRTSNFTEGDKMGFELNFHFAENPYFTNTVLRKRYFLEEDDMFGEVVLSHAEGTEIKWKTGKNLTVKSVKKKAKSKGKKGAAPKVITVDEPTPSFFTFFTPPQVDDEEEEEEDEEGEEPSKEELLEMDFEVGCKIKDSIIPYSVLWYTGEAAQFEDDGYGDMDFFNGGEDDEDDEEDEEDDEEEEEQPKGRRGGARGGKFAPSAPGKQSSIPQSQQPECKQQ